MAAMMQGPKPEAAGSGVALGQLGQKPRQVMACCIASVFFLRICLLLLLPVSRYSVRVCLDGAAAPRAGLRLRLVAEFCFGTFRE